MTIISYLSAFRLYGADVLILAAGVTIVTALLKKSVFKNRSKKLYVVLPFIIGLLFYTAYRLFAAWSVAPLTEEWSVTLEGGFACGCAATLYYVVYEQFFRPHNQSRTATTTANPLVPLLQGFVAKEKIDEAADAMYAGSAALCGDALTTYLTDTLKRYALFDLTDAEVAVCAALAEKMILTLRKE